MQIVIGAIIILAVFFDQFIKSRKKGEGLKKLFKRA
jgi:ribose transport system permease protein